MRSHLAQQSALLATNYDQSRRYVARWVSTSWLDPISVWSIHRGESRSEKWPNVASLEIAKFWLTDVEWKGPQ